MAEANVVEAEPGREREWIENMKKRKRKNRQPSANSEAATTNVAAEKKTRG
jgi:hypothetical protein